MDKRRDGGIYYKEFLSACTYNSFFKGLSPDGVIWVIDPKLRVKDNRSWFHPGAA